MATRSLVEIKRDSSSPDGIAASAVDFPSKGRTCVISSSGFTESSRHSRTGPAKGTKMLLHGPARLPQACAKQRPKQNETEPLTRPNALRRDPNDSRPNSEGEVPDWAPAVKAYPRHRVCPKEKWRAQRIKDALTVTELAAPRMPSSRQLHAMPSLSQMWEFPKIKAPTTIDLQMLGLLS